MTAANNSMYSILLTGYSEKPSFSFPYPGALMKKLSSNLVSAGQLTAGATVAEKNAFFTAMIASE